MNRISIWYLCYSFPISEHTEKYAIFPFIYSHMHQDIRSEPPHMPRITTTQATTILMSQLPINSRTKAEPTNQGPPIQNLRRNRAVASTSPHMEHDRPTWQPIRHSAPPPRPIKRRYVAALRHSIRPRAGGWRPASQPISGRSRRAAANQHSVT